MILYHGSPVHPAITMPLEAMANMYLSRIMTAKEEKNEQRN